MKMLKFEVTYEKAGFWLFQKRFIYAVSLQEAQEIACRLCDDHLRRVQTVVLI